jgi:signal transduction histidine kinase
MRTDGHAVEHRAIVAGLPETGLPVRTGRQAADGIVDAALLVVGVAETTRILVGSKPVSVEVSVPSLPVVVTTDPGILGRIILNLARNAVQLTERGTITIALHIIGSTLEVVVTGTGSGLRQNSSADPSAAGDRIGAAMPVTDMKVGPGLITSRDLARLIGGSITMRSVYGRGAMFTLTLPLPTEERRGGLYAVE